MSNIEINELPAYKDFLEQTKTKIHGSRVRAPTAATRELIALY